MCFTFEKNNKQTKKPADRFLQDDASAGIRSLQTSIEIKLCQNPWNGLYVTVSKVLGNVAILIKHRNSRQKLIVIHHCMTHNYPHCVDK